MSVLDGIRPEIRALRPYEAAEQVDDTIRLNANEAPWSNSTSQFRRPLNRYPEVRPSKLRALLADFYQCPAECLAVTRGTSEGIDLLIRVFCRAGQDAILTVNPTFSMYRHYAQVQGANLIEFSTSAEDDFSINVDQLISQWDAAVRLVFICSPNNPTGNSIPVSDLVRILEERPQTAVVVDEAYVEFSAQASAVGLLMKYENLIVLRTLSKALACAGARCGSVMASKEIVDIVSAVQAPYALATPVVECVEGALLNDGISKSRHWANEIISEREALLENIGKFEFVERIWPSDANFFLCQMHSADAVLAHCTAQGVLLRSFGKDLNNCIRITVGSPSENSRLLSVLADYDGANT
ncbi:MAG: histidinol-phosphate transaminase [Woeseiaceae bacterium]